MTKRLFSTQHVHLRSVPKAVCGGFANCASVFCLHEGRMSNCPARQLQRTTFKLCPLRQIDCSLMVASWLSMQDFSSGSQLRTCRAIAFPDWENVGLMCLLGVYYTMCLPKVFKEAEKTKLQKEFSHQTWLYRGVYFQRFRRPLPLTTHYFKACG